MSRKKPTYNFINPNTDEQTVEYIMGVFAEVAYAKLKKAQEEHIKNEYCRLLPGLHQQGRPVKQP